MKPTIPALLFSLIAVALAGHVGAMPSGAVAKDGPGAYPMDCTQADDKARCAALNKKVKACRDKTDDEWRACMDRPARAAKFTLPKPRDCTKARNKEVCAAHTEALQACKEVPTHAEHRKCMAEQLRVASARKS